MQFISNVQNLRLQLHQLLLREHSLRSRISHLLVVFGALTRHHCQFIVRLISLIALLFDGLLVDVLQVVICRRLLVKHRVLHLDFLLLRSCGPLFLILLFLACPELVLRGHVGFLALALVFSANLCTFLLITDLLLPLFFLFALEDALAGADCRTSTVLILLSLLILLAEIDVAPASYRLSSALNGMRRGSDGALLVLAKVVAR